MASSPTHDAQTPRALSDSPGWQQAGTFPGPVVGIHIASDSVFVQTLSGLYESYAFARHPQRSDWWYLGTATGLYASSDRGATWVQSPTLANRRSAR